MLKTCLFLKNFVIVQNIEEKVKILVIKNRMKLCAVFKISNFDLFQKLCNNEI